MEFPIDTMCKVLEVSRSAYYNFRNKDTYCPPPEKVKLNTIVASEFSIHKSRYGSRRLGKSLQKQGIPIGRHAIRTIMKEEGLKAIQPRSFVPKTTDSNHNLGYSPNLLEGKAFPVSPNQVYVGDITYLPFEDGRWLYLSTWMDLYSRKIAGWKVDSHMEESIVIDSLKQAFNAFAESFFSRFKAEELQKKIYKSKQQATSEVFEYIEMYYNTHRLHSALDYTTPNDYENNYYKSKSI